MTNFIANDLIIVKLPKQFNWQVFNLIDNSLLFTGNENEKSINHTNKKNLRYV